MAPQMFIYRIYITGAVIIDILDLISLKQMPENACLGLFL